MRSTIRWVAILALTLLLAACNRYEAALDRVEGFNVGQDAEATSAPAAYVLFDPQCPYCAALWRNFEPLRAQVTVKWIPVGLLTETSKIQAAMLLESVDPQALMEEHQAEFLATGAAPSAVAPVSEEALRSVQRNNHVLDALQTRSIPTLVYRDRTSGDLTIKSGVLSTRELGQIFGIETPEEAAE